MPTNKTELIQMTPSTVKEQLVQEIFMIAYLANKQAGRIFRFDYTPNVDSLTVIVAKSKELFNDWLYHLSIYPDRTSAEELLKFKETLLDLINGEDLDMDLFPEYNFTGLQVSDHRNDPPYVYDEDEDDA